MSGMQPVELLIVVLEFAVYLTELLVLLLVPALDLFDGAPADGDVPVGPFDLLAKFFPAPLQIFLHLVQSADDVADNIFVAPGELILELLDPPFQKLELLPLVRRRLGLLVVKARQMAALTCGARDALSERETDASASLAFDLGL